MGWNPRVPGDRTRPPYGDGQPVGTRPPVVALPAPSLVRIRGGGGSRVAAIITGVRPLPAANHQREFAAHCVGTAPSAPCSTRPPPWPGPRSTPRPMNVTPMSTERMRREHDLLGDIDVPASAYWGAHTARAVENFPISGMTSASQPTSSPRWPPSSRPRRVANRDVGELDRPWPTRSRPRARTSAPGASARPVRRRPHPGRGRHVDQHERQRGDREPRARAPRQRAATTRSLHPLEHVNHGQSTNDVYPTAIKLALRRRHQAARRARGALRAAFAAKAAEFAACSRSAAPSCRTPCR